MFLRYAFLADTVSIDKNEKLSAIGIFDVIGATKFPVRHRDMFLVASIEGNNTEKGQHNITVELRDDDDNRLALIEQSLMFSMSAGIQGISVGRFILKIQDFVFPKPGQYQLVLFSDNRFIGRILFVLAKINDERAGES